MKNLRRSIALMFAVSFLLLFAAIPAQAASNTVDVKCVDQAGNPLAGVKVFAINVATNKSKDKKSDKGGLARFTKLDNGGYRFLARQQGFDPALYEFVAVTDDSQDSIELRFQPGNMEKKLYFEDQSVYRQSEEALNRSIEAFQAQKFPEAEKELIASLDLNPSNPQALLQLAIAQIQQRKWDLGEATLKRGEVLSSTMAKMPLPAGPTGAEIFKELGVRFRDILGKIPLLRDTDSINQALAEKRFEDAVAQSDKALLKYASEPDLHYNRAVALGNLKKFDEAIASVDKALQLKPNESAYTTLKGQLAALKQNNLLTQAQAILDEGNKLFDGGKHAEALAKFEQALSMVPQDKHSIVYPRIARAQAELNHPDEAVAAYRKAIEMAPENVENRKALAQYYMQIKRYEEALDLYADPGAAGSDPPDKTLLELGKNLSNKGNPEVAVLALEKAIKVNPANAEIYYELGMLLYFQKTNDTRAKELLNKYAEIGKDSGHIDNAKSVLVVIKKRSP